MARTVKHFSLHRIGRTELRVVAEMETGVLPLIQVEEAVIRGYAKQGLWPCRSVTLFVLQDLQPLIRQLHAKANLPPGGTGALDHRPVVNVYDLAAPADSHIFINQQAMRKEGYWDNPLAIQGLLSHEHAHPLAENETTRSSRCLEVELAWKDKDIEIWERKNGEKLATFQETVHRLLTLLADKLCLYAPREVFANDVAIRSGFSESLLYLDRCNVLNASRSVAGREELRQQLQQKVTRGNLTPAAADVLLLIGDMKGYVDLALEVAPFYRTGHEAEAQGLETVLKTEVFPHLEPEVPRAYTTLREQYVALNADLTPDELVAWGAEVLNILAKALTEKGLIVQYRLRVAAGRGEEE